MTARLNTDALIYARAATITKHDSTNIPEGPTDAIYVGGSGNMVVVFMDNSTVTFAVVAGQVLPVRAKRVNSTNTTATNMAALYL